MTMSKQWVVRTEGLGSAWIFTWDVATDDASLHREGSDLPIWRGPLLPTLALGGDEPQWVRPRVAVAESVFTDASLDLAVNWSDVATGRVRVEQRHDGIELAQVEVAWRGAARPIVDVVWGAAGLDDRQWSTVSDLSEPMWPGWRAEAYCVPSAKPGPCQSFFRRWDPGRAVWPLGNFGPALGAPYAAAFPRPVYAAAMGDDGPDRGWVVLGAGAIPDGAMTLELKGSTAWLRWRLREDLWGAADDAVRRWTAPLRLCWARRAYDAWANYFATFPQREPSPPHHLASVWNTWGNFMHRRFDLDDDLQNARRSGAEVICIDDGWETFVSSGEPDRERFERFDEQLAAIRDAGLGVGFWQAVGWVANPEACGLTADDLLCGVDRQPRLANWSQSPFEGGKPTYCLDPSSPRATAFLKQRTRRIVQRLRPAMLKLDFYYGLPSPDAAAPRDPALRGERMGHRLTEIIVDAAREADPAITIEGFSIHPLWEGLFDVVSLDDQGDSDGVHNPSFETACHWQWSAWAALCGPRGQAINGSSGYAIEADPEATLNSLVLGGVGSIQPTVGYAHREAGALALRVRQAATRWSARRALWRPVWFNSETGRVGHEPATRCWGRAEPATEAATETATPTDDAWALTVLVLRPGGEAPDLPAWLRSFHGRWGLVSLDRRDLRDSRQWVAIPFDNDARLRVVLGGVARVFTDDGATQRDWPSGGGEIELTVNAAFHERAALAFVIRRR